MIPVLFQLPPITIFGLPIQLTIYSFGLMMALGAIVGNLVLTSECRRRGYNPDFANAVVVWGAIAGIAGARIYDVFDNWPLYRSNPWSIFFSGAGFVWYGGLVAGILATLLVARRYKVPILTALDMCAPALILGQAFGRMGCQLSGDGDWGLPSTLPWAMAYPHAIVGWNAQSVLKLDDQNQLVSGFFPGVRVHPAPVYEVIMYVSIFLVLWSLRKKTTVEGRILYLYLMLAGLARFLAEFVRINPRVLWGLSEAQFISIVMMAAGAGAWYWSSVRQPAAHTAREELRV
jgi:phosphatidylglycerol:prolipoprotein diacylglycerol transferase